MKQKPHLGGALLISDCMFGFEVLNVGVSYMSERNNEIISFTQDLGNDVYRFCDSTIYSHTAMIIDNKTVYTPTRSQMYFMNEKEFHLIE